MRNENLKLILKRCLLVGIAFYVVYTFFVQQQNLNAYKADEQRYQEQIKEEEEKKERLAQTKANINSEEYIEEIARDRLDMYLPNEKVFVDMNK